MIKEAGMGYFGLEFAGIFDLCPAAAFFCYFDLKLLISLSFLPSAASYRCEFTVYKKSPVDRHYPLIS
jgi:hypothetical protein